MIVYILQSLKDKGYYIGCTSDMEKRIEAHNSGKTRSLRSRRPLILIYAERHDNSKDAYIRERQIKSYKGGLAFKKLLESKI